MASQLRQQLLTELLDFANGSWNWTEVLKVGPNRATFQTLVLNANQALTSKTLKAMQTALNALQQVQGPQPPQQLTLAPSANGIRSFGTVNTTTAATETITVTNPDPHGKLNPLPGALTVKLTGSSAFTIVGNTCPPGPPSPPGPPPGQPPLTKCTVTVKFEPTSSDTPYNTTLIVSPGPPPPHGGPTPPIMATLTLTGTSA
jgi:hypothetical protein